jgi:hypothetical protein
MLDAFKTNGSSPPRDHCVRLVRGQRLSTHFAAHLQRLSKDHRHEAASAVRELAVRIRIAVEQFNRLDSNFAVAFKNCLTGYAGVGARPSKSFPLPVRVDVAAAEHRRSRLHHARVSSNGSCLHCRRYGALCQFFAQKPILAHAGEARTLVIVDNTRLVPLKGGA